MEPGVAYSPISSPKIQETNPGEPYRPPTKLVAVGFGLIVLILLGVYAFKYVKKPVEINAPVPTPTIGTYFPTAVSTPIVLDTNPGWKQYVDSTNVFSVKYPPEYTLKNYNESAFSGIELDFSKPATSASASAQIVVKIIYLAHSAKTAEQFAHDQNLLEKGSTLSGLTLSLKGEWGRGVIIFKQQGDTVYRLSSVIAAPLNLIPGYEDTINKIFASFTILNPDDRGK